MEDEPHHVSKRSAAYDWSIAMQAYLGGQKVLVYVCTVVTAIFDVMTEED